ncbi:ABC transporter substrate-binding protein [Echinicola soli]|uniref:ABC transporter substrate-binding protein n=1 Tax=Echinicola soli TaxID=2591634 RepID=A0A514CNC7_9BACT|nr:ABC transporter substrate-binding protein [Echinicola soli]QDH81323.1 ABC transporter substrate-binding protein [Echinicola soli]
MMKVGLFIPFSGQVSHVQQEIRNGLGIGVNSDEWERVDFAVQYYQSNVQEDLQLALLHLESVSGVSLILAVMDRNHESAMMACVKNCRCPIVLINMIKSRPVRDHGLRHVFMNSLFLSSSQFVLANFVRDLLDQQSCICLSEIGGITGLWDSLSGADHIKGNLMGYCQDASDLIKVLEVSSKSLFSASTWFRELQNEANVEFVEHYQRRFAAIPSPFALLAYEIGLLLRNQYQKKYPRSQNSIVSALRRINVTGPRGAINLRADCQRSSVVYVSKVGTRHKGGDDKREIVCREEYREASCG